ncbi:NT-3 growth factor receptor-like [Entelurus aequoreus]|uniref:NT-3 growth factor receptor-like n=1 Tax=Entelurus aequoreus TaxID=161455 RepID=UPI002B1E0474|nr:NT-3 growth factor receptor-like [Entelurus aequoreus]
MTKHSEKNKSLEMFLAAVEGGEKKPQILPGVFIGVLIKSNLTPPRGVSQKENSGEPGWQLSKRATVPSDAVPGIEQRTLTSSNYSCAPPSQDHFLRQNLSKNPLSTLSWQLFQHLQLAELRLDGVVFKCGCDVRWIQLWQERGEAGLHAQQLYCRNGASKMKLHNMYIQHCDLPEISVSPSSDVLVMEGDNVTVSCNGTAEPTPEVDWTVSGLQSINTHLSNVYWPNIHSINLTLFNISRDDNNYQLTCIAENVVGMTNWSIELKVQFPPVILTLAEPEQRHDTCIEFTVRGSPKPKLRWFHKNKEIIHNQYIRTEMMEYHDYLEGCLTLQNPTHINNGNYTLEASNSLGTVNKTVYGHFLMAPGLDDEDVVELVPSAPTDSDSGRPDEDTFGVSIAVGLAGFACVLLLVLFVLINKYGRRSKFGMKGGANREAELISGLRAVRHARGLASTSLCHFVGRQRGLEFSISHTQASTCVAFRHVPLTAANGF